MIILKLQILHYMENMICETNDQKITNNDEEYKKETSKIQEGNESADNSETLGTLRDDIIIKTTK